MRNMRIKMTNFHKKNILISGGSSGIGLALAKKFSSLGSNVIILARDKAKLSSAAKSINKLILNPNQVISTISADVRDFKNLESQINKNIEPIDVLINSAGITYPGRFLDLDPQIYEDIILTNYMGTVNLTKLIAPGMAERKSGTIVNISSLAGLVGIFGYTAYAPSKYAIRGFSRCLRSELKPYGINVYLVLPPDTDTPQLAFEREIMPETTKKINSSAGKMSPESVADVIVKGIRKNKFKIIPGFEGKILALFSPIIEHFLYKFAVKQESKSIH